jgi:hypothetical protein
VVTTAINLHMTVVVVFRRVALTARRSGYVVLAAMDIRPSSLTGLLHRAPRGNHRVTHFNALDDRSLALWRVRLRHVHHVFRCDVLRDSNGWWVTKWQVRSLIRWHLRSNEKNSVSFSRHKTNSRSTSSRSQWQVLHRGTRFSTPSPPPSKAVISRAHYGLIGRSLGGLAQDDGLISFSRLGTFV